MKYILLTYESNMEGGIEIVIEKVFKIFKIEKVFKIIAQYFDLITTNQIDSCALYFWWHMTNTWHAL